VFWALMPYRDSSIPKPIRVKTAFSSASGLAKSRGLRGDYGISGMTGVSILLPV